MHLLLVLIILSLYFNQGINNKILLFDYDRIRIFFFYQFIRIYVATLIEYKMMLHFMSNVSRAKLKV